MECKQNLATMGGKKHEPYPLSEMLDLRILETEILKLVLNVLRFAWSVFDLGHFDAFQL
jgi:hypothetical protein